MDMMLLQTAENEMETIRELRDISRGYLESLGAREDIVLPDVMRANFLPILLELFRRKIKTLRPGELYKLKDSPSMMIIDPKLEMTGGASSKDNYVIVPRDKIVLFVGLEGCYSEPSKPFRGYTFWIRFLVDDRVLYRHVTELHLLDEDLTFDGASVRESVRCNSSLANRIHLAKETNTRSFELVHEEWQQPI